MLCNQSYRGRYINIPIQTPGSLSSVGRDKSKLRYTLVETGLYELGFGAHLTPSELGRKIKIPLCDTFSEDREQDRSLCVSADAERPSRWQIDMCLLTALTVCVTADGEKGEVLKHYS